MSNLKLGSIISYFNILLSIAIGFVTAPLLLNGFGENEYGAYQMVVSLVGYMSILDLGLHNVTTRFVAKYNAKNEVKEQENFLAINMILFSAISIVIMIVGIGIYCNIKHFFNASMTNSEILLVKKLFSILVVNLAISMPGAVFASVVTAYEKFIFSRLVTTVKMVIRLLFIIVLINANIKSLGLVITDFLLNICVILLNMFYCFKKLRIRIKLHSFDISVVKLIFSFSIFVFIASITDQINWKVDTVIIGAAIGTAAVSQYSIASQLISYYRSFSSAISGIFLPRATKMVALGKNNEELTDLMIQVGRIQLIIVGIVLGGFILIGKNFISLWIGSGYKDAYYWFVGIAFSLVIPLTQSIGINILEAKFMHKFRALVYLFISVLNLFLTVVLVKKIGINGAVAGTAISVFIGNNIIINWYYYKKVGLEIPRFFKEVYGRLFPLQVLLFALSGLIINLTLRHFDGWIFLCIKGIIICIVYSVGIILFGLNNNEKKMLKNFM